VPADDGRAANGNALSLDIVIFGTACLYGPLAETKGRCGAEKDELSILYGIEECIWTARVISFAHTGRRKC